MALLNAYRQQQGCDAHGFEMALLPYIRKEAVVIGRAALLAIVQTSILNLAEPVKEVVLHELIASTELSP